MTNNKTEKISKGYRLQPSTHELILKLRVLSKRDNDHVISRACRIYYQKLLKRKN